MDRPEDACDASLPPIRRFPPPPRRRLLRGERPPEPPRPPDWTAWSPDPPPWWPDDREGWERAVTRSGWKAPVVEVEFDGLLVRCDLQGRVAAADVIAPERSGPRWPAMGIRVRVGLAATLVGVVVTPFLDDYAQQLLAPVAACWVAGIGFLALRDERTRRALPADDRDAAVARHAAARRRSEDRRTAGRDRDLPDHSHRMLWELATAEDDTARAAAREQHVSLLAGVRGVA